MCNSEKQLFAILATLEECRAALVANGNPETARLVSVAALDLRMKLGRISEDELIALCEAAQPTAASVAHTGSSLHEAGPVPRRAQARARD